MPTLPSLADFQGRWKIERTIKDKRAGIDGTLSGEATLSPRAQGGLTYEETGKLSYGPKSSMEATRRYLWLPHAQGIEVQFDDGRPFHVIVLQRLMPDTNHHCDPDLYHVSYDFRTFPQWQSVWRVVGPMKDYRMVTKYEPAS
jgi:hypothetical protein